MITRSQQHVAMHILAATSTELGGVKVNGGGLSIDGDGLLSDDAQSLLAAITPHIDMIRTETPHDWVTAYTLTKGPADLKSAQNMFSTRDPMVMSTCELAEQMKVVIFILPEEHSKFSVE